MNAGRSKTPVSTGTYDPLGPALDLNSGLVVGKPVKQAGLETVDGSELGHEERRFTPVPPSRAGPLDAADVEDREIAVARGQHALAETAILALCHFLHVVLRASRSWLSWSCSVPQ